MANRLAIGSLIATLALAGGASLSIPAQAAPISGIMGPAREAAANTQVDLAGYYRRRGFSFYSPFFSFSVGPRYGYYGPRYYGYGPYYYGSPYYYRPYYHRHRHWRHRHW